MKSLAVMTKQEAPSVPEYCASRAMESAVNRLRAGGPVPLLSYDATHEIDLTIFVACYNEAANIIDTLDTTVEAMNELGISYEIIVIDDGSRDDSVRLVREYQEKHPQVPLLLKVNAINRGLGRNFVDAAFLGRGKYYRLVCGDNVESKEKLVQIVGQIGRADLVLPHHEVVDGKSRGRVFLSGSYTRIVNLLSGHRIRYYNGSALYLRYHVMRWSPNTDGFGFQALLITKLLDGGVDYVELLCDARERTEGDARAVTFKNLLSVLHAFAQILAGRLKRSLYGRRRVLIGESVTGHDARSAGNSERHSKAA